MSETRRRDDSTIDKLLIDVTELRANQEQFKEDICRLEEKLDGSVDSLASLVEAWEALGWLGRAIKYIAGMIAAIVGFIYIVKTGKPG